MSEKVSMDTSLGEIVIALDSEKAPETVKNFLQYVDSGFYDGTIFHRVINGFMIQGGGFDTQMKEKPTEAPIKNEADNNLKNNQYTIAMARTSDVNSATSQFFINVADNDFLNFSSPTPQGYGYCVFGAVSSGQDTVDAIKKVATGNDGFHQDVPTEQVLINKVARAES